ncbi:MAG: lysophospholipid acyltransferase family protein [Phycisphaerae bacterium]
MLPAKPNPLVTWWFDRWCATNLHNSFSAIRLYGDLAPLAAGVPTLLVANHVSFWDGIVLNWLLRKHSRLPRYCMIDERQVIEHPFFRRIGGFSVRRGDPRDGLAAMAYARQRLAEPAVVVIFPQGRIVPIRRRPLAFERGVGRLLEAAAAAQVLLVALHYEFWEEQRPELLVRIEKQPDMAAMPRSRRPQMLETRLGELLDELEAACLARDPGRVLLEGKVSISRWKEQYRRK